MARPQAVSRCPSSMAWRYVRANIEGSPTGFSFLPKESGYPLFRLGDPRPYGFPSIQESGSQQQAGYPSPYALRGSPPWGHHLPSDCCPVYLRWPTGPLWGSFWSTRTLTNTRRGGNLGRRMRCSPPVADTLKVFPQYPPQPSSVPDANLHRIPKRGKHDDVTVTGLGVLDHSTGYRLPSLLLVIC